MCVIVSAEPGHMPTATQLAKMSDANGDGGGVAWYDGERLRCFKSADNHKVLGFILSNYDMLEGVACIMHFRLATNGKVCDENCHPFRTKYGYVAHNGIASDYVNGVFASDSRNAIREWERSGADDTVLDNQGKFCLLDTNGGIRWIIGGESLSKGVRVSNFRWIADKDYYSDVLASRGGVYGRSRSYYDWGEPYYGGSTYVGSHDLELEDDVDDIEDGSAQFQDALENDDENVRIEGVKVTK